MRVFSGIQPTGVIHLGNYFGALVNWVAMQDEGHECFFSIVNQHAITQPQKKEDLEKNTLEVAATLYAVGLDPEKSTIFVQSDVPAHAQLAWVFNCLAPLGQMERMIQFKEKSEKNPSAVNLGLFAYPVLQAADVLLYKTECVPVGIDQAQHLELTRDIARKFNNAYTELFPEPETLHTKTTKILGLDGHSKMSKSLDNYIGLAEPSEVIWEKIRTAATDPARVRKTDPGNPFICNIYKLHTLFSQQKDVDYIVEGCQTAGIGSVDCKKILFQNIDAHLTPIRDRYNEHMSNPKRLKELLKMGAERAQNVANQTLEEVYEAVGFNY